MYRKTQDWGSATMRPAACQSYKFSPGPVPIGAWGYGLVGGPRDAVGRGLGRLGALHPGSWSETGDWFMD